MVAALRVRLGLPRQLRTVVWEVSDDRATGVRRVATYERVSSEDQRERETIKTQTDQLDRGSNGNRTSRSSQGSAMTESPVPSHLPIGRVGESYWPPPREGRSTSCGSTSWIASAAILPDTAATRSPP